MCHLKVASNKYLPETSRQSICYRQENGLPVSFSTLRFVVYVSEMGACEVCITNLPEKK